MGRIQEIVNGVGEKLTQAQGEIAKVNPMAREQVRAVVSPIMQSVAALAVAVEILEREGR